MSVISIDMGGTLIKMGGFERDLLVYSVSIPSQSDSPMIEKLNIIENQIHSWLEQGLSNPQCIALSIPGIVDQTNQKVLKINGKHEDAVDTDFGKWAKRNFDCPLILQNDAIAALMAEWKYGRVRNLNNVVMVTLGTGIGTAAIVDGNIIQGAGHFAGNLGGHLITSTDESILCNCRANGCAEAQASTWALGTNYKELWEEADNGNDEAVGVIDATLKTWARLIHNLILSYSPKAVLIGGGISKRGNSLIEDLVQRLPSSIWYDSKDINFELATLDDMAGVYGGKAASEKLLASVEAVV